MKQATDKQNLDATLIHELWCCRREFDSFINYSALLIFNKSINKEDRVLAFTSYGNFIRHLYSFYEGVILHKNADLLKKYSGNKESEKKDEILNDEVKKLIRNKVMRYKAKPELNIREIEHLTKTDVPLDFGKHFRLMRNRFSHVDEKRVNKEEISLTEFFDLYHKYLILLLESSSFSWGKEVIENTNLAEIENFLA